jgi:hypothetical protein
MKKIGHITGSMLVGILLVLRVSAQPTSIDFPVTENDTLHYKLQLKFDDAGNPSHFYRAIFTPVCYTGECKPVYINFYWDLLGNYTKYDLPPREILTKMDHDEFTEDDYLKLQEILANSASLLGEVSIDDLVGSGSENLADSVDAKTGATLKTIKREVIEGAVYTCYTLWHIAYGKVAVAKMREITETLSTPDLLRRFLQSQNHHYQYWALDRVIDADGTPQIDYKAEIKDLIEGNNTFLERALLQRLNASFFETQQEQEWLLDVFSRKTYPTQLAILEKMASIRLAPSTLSSLIGLVERSNLAQMTKILSLLKLQMPLSSRHQRELSSLLTQLSADRATDVHQLLISNPFLS